MRQIKFREWLGKEFHYWGFMEDGSFILPTNIKGPQQQFTGLLDKNGKEVYQGDIIKRSTGYKFEMKLGQYILGRPTDSKVYGYNWQEGDEVISNVFENPDLLK